MADYTGLRCKIHLKEEFIPVIERVLEEESWGRTGNQVLDVFNTMARSRHIPFVSVNFTPKEWDIGSEGAFGGYTEARTVENGVWSFWCSLNNDLEIEYFRDVIIPMLSDNAPHIEMLFEHDKVSRMWKYTNGVWETLPGLPYPF